MFGKTRERIDTFVSDRVTSPIRTAVMISVAAFAMAALALLLTARNANAVR